MLINTPTSQQSAMIHSNNGSSQFIIKSIFSPSSEGAHTAHRFIVKLDAAAKGVQAVCLPMLTSAPTPHFEGAQAPSGRQEYPVVDIAFQQLLPIKGVCIAPATFDKAFKFIVNSTSIANFQLIVGSDSEGAQFAPMITASVKVASTFFNIEFKLIVKSASDALHSEGAQTVLILSIKLHGPASKLIVICDWTKYPLSFEKIAQYFVRENGRQQQQ